VARPVCAGICFESAPSTLNVVGFAKPGLFASCSSNFGEAARLASQLTT